MPPAHADEPEGPTASLLQAGPRSSWGLTPYEKLAVSDGNSSPFALSSAGGAVGMPGQIEDERPRTPPTASATARHSAGAGPASEQVTQEPTLSGLSSIVLDTAPIPQSEALRSTEGWQEVAVARIGSGTGGEATTCDGDASFAQSTPAMPFRDEEAGEAAEAAEGGMKRRVTRSKSVRISTEEKSEEGLPPVRGNAQLFNKLGKRSKDALITTPLTLPPERMPGLMAETGNTATTPVKNGRKGLGGRSGGTASNLGSTGEMFASSQMFKDSLLQLEQEDDALNASAAAAEAEEVESPDVINASNSDQEAKAFLSDYPIKSNEETPISSGDVPVKKGGVRFGRGNSQLNRSSSFMDFAGRKKAGGGKTPQSMASVFDFKEDESPVWRRRVNAAFNSWPLLIFYTFLTVWALFGDDFRLAVCPPEADPFFEGVTYFMLAAFAVELVILSVVKPGYMFSFYFWLDFIATASLIFDIPAVNEAMLDSSNEDTADSTTLARAGRTSRVGTRAGRIARVVRVIRLVRMLKIYKAVSAYVTKMRNWEKDDDLNEPRETETVNKDDDDQSNTVESRVGVKLTELTTRRVIIGVLLMLFVLPVFQVDSGYYGAPDPFEFEGLRMLHNMYLSDEESAAFDAALATYTEQVGFSIAGQSTNRIINLDVCNVTHEYRSSDDRRDSELSSFIVSTGCENSREPGPEGYDIDPGVCYISAVVTDNKWDSQFEAILNMCRTTFTCFVLGLGALLFSRDANALVLHPLERMVQKVKEMSENPLAKMQIRAVATKDEQQMETRILENSITKICSLLAVGFGDAGAEVVAENIRNGGDLNPMVPGHRMVAIFGFCDIRRFTDATEVLQEEVMEFVNSIAKIVHMEVSLHGGSANKNIGDAFLLVWKLPTQLASNSDNLALAAANLPDEKREGVAHLADRALAAFVVIHVALKRSPRLKQFCMRDDIRARMGDNFEVSMGFGLHVGWAIEGAIGSEYKIDASYLSPNVNMASRLEAATKQFGCSLLMSDDFADLLSPGVRRLCRAIDVITVKGSNKPITLYTYDISLSSIAGPGEYRFQEDNMESLSHSFLSFKSEFEENPDITESIGSSQDYRDNFAVGFQAYIEGRWEEAKNIMVTCLNRIDPSGVSVTDGPTASLLEVMGRYDFIAPRSWKGVRALTEK